MDHGFYALLAGDTLQSLVTLVLLSALYLALGVVPVGASVYVIYFLLTIPMRRNERARWFLDLLELGLKRGQLPEQTTVETASSGDRALGVRFHLVAAHIEEGMSLAEALKRVPRFLPPQIVSMLKVGERIGNLAKVLPACRKLLADGVSHVRGALNYVLIVTFVLMPATFVIPILLKVFVLPKYREVFNGLLEGAAMPAFTRLVFAGDNYLVGLEIVFFVAVLGLTLAYVAGPRWEALLRRLVPGAVDWLQTHLSWRRKRLQRDFSSMLTMMLDLGLPEGDALKLAAESTNNGILIRRSAAACAMLEKGARLQEALRTIEGAGEFQWRLSNALQRGSGFSQALAGWHESLDARAFQLEQTAAQILTTAFVLFNGLVVACIVTAVFLVLVQIINGALLW